MPDFLIAPFSDGPTVAPLDVLIRLLVALALGSLVAWVYRRTCKSTEAGCSFPTTLVLLCILIAMVTQVIGDNIARAFSLVGALSIVRFRTVVRDTQDTAYVIFAVVVGMAVGARNLWVAGIGIVVVTLAGFIWLSRTGLSRPSSPEFLLRLRVSLDQNLETLLRGAAETYLVEHELLAIGTAKQGTLIEATYRARLRPKSSIEELVKVLSSTEKVQSVQLQQRGVEDC